MVDRISKPIPPPPPRPVRKVNKSEAVTQENQAVNAAPEPLVKRVMSKVQQEEVQSEAKLRRQMIFHTLTDILGEKSANEPKFIELVDKIDRTLSNSPVTSEQLKDILNKNLKK